jgi:hypothetical protein
MDIEALTIGLRKAADDYDDTIRMIVRLAGELGVDTNAVVGYTIEPQRAQSEHSPLIREAAEALTTMQAREATLIRVLEGMVAFGEEMEREHLVGDEGCFWPVELARDALLNFRDEALGTSGLVP